MVSSVDLRQLQYFLAAIENGSLGRAARELRISEPALSKSLRRLETTLGVPLLERGARGVRPTVFGASLAEHARLIRMELRKAVDDLDELRHGGEGHVVLGTGPTFAATLLPRATARLVRERPGVRVTVVEGLLDTLLPALLCGDLDFVVAALGAQAPDPALEQQVLIRDYACPVVRAQHPAAHAARVTLADLKDQAWVLPRNPDIMRMAVDQLFRRQGLAPPRAAIEYAALNYALAVICENDFVSFLPKQLARMNGVADRLRFLDVPGGTWHRRYGLLRRKNSVLSPAARALLQELRSQFRTAAEL